MGTFCKAGARRGAIAWMPGASGAPSAGHSFRLPGVAEWSARGSNRADVVAASLTNDNGEVAR
eukprot:2278886-Pyramimonas_sp.AAC.1